MHRSPYRESLRKQFIAHAEKVRLERMWSYADMAEKLGITKQAYSKYRTDARNRSSAPNDPVLRKARKHIGFEQFEYNGLVIPVGLGPSGVSEDRKEAVQLSFARQLLSGSTIRIPLGRSREVEEFLELKRFSRSRKAS